MFKKGDEVGFKGDHEQHGTVVAVEMKRNWMGERYPAFFIQVSYDYYDHDIRPYQHPKHGHVVMVDDAERMWKL